MQKRFILKDAGVLLIALFMVLSTVIVTGSEQVSLQITALNDPPTVEITNPQDGDDVSGTVIITATASDDVGVVRVTFHIDDLVIGYDDTAPYSCTWDTTTYNDGGHTISAIAYDSEDKMGSDEITVYVGGNCDEFMDLQVCPLGDALLDIDENLQVYNCDDEGEDGLWINLEDTYNQWDCIIENPDIYNSLPLGASLRVDFTGIIENVPNQYLYSLIRTKIEHYKWELSVESISNSYNVIALLDDETIFSKTGVTSSVIGYVIEEPFSFSFVVGEDSFDEEDFDWHILSIYNVDMDKYYSNIEEAIDEDNYGDTIEILGIHPVGFDGSATDNGCISPHPSPKPKPQSDKASFKLRGDASDYVKWSWPSEDVFDVLIDTLVIVHNNPNPETFAYSGISIYASDIPEFSVREMYAYINHPPEIPTIEGLTSGIVGAEYEYFISATDLDEDNIYYYIEWGDGTNSSWLGPYSSGTEITLKHVWDEKADYIIKAIVSDDLGYLSEWTEIEVSMPKPKAINSPILNFPQQYPKLFPILRQLLQLLKL